MHLECGILGRNSLNEPFGSSRDAHSAMYPDPRALPKPLRGAKGGFWPPFHGSVHRIDVQCSKKGLRLLHYIFFVYLYYIYILLLLKVYIHVEHAHNTYT